MFNFYETEYERFIEKLDKVCFCDILHNLVDTHVLLATLLCIIEYIYLFRYIYPRLRSKSHLLCYDVTILFYEVCFNCYVHVC